MDKHRISRPWGITRYVGNHVDLYIHWTDGKEDWHFHIIMN